MLASHIRPAATLLIAAGIVLAVATPAQAHSYLVASTPTAGAVVTELPQAFSVTTNESLLDLSGDGAGFAIEVTDAAGLYYGDGCIAIVDSTMSTGASLGDAGDYRMLWQLVSSDGHTVSGEIDFAWAPPAGAATAGGSPTPPNCGSEAGSVPTDSATPPVVRDNANLGDVLWIGGAIAAVLLAGAVTLIVATRRRKA